MPAGRSTRRATFDFPPVDKAQGFDVLDVMRPIAEAHGASIAQVGLAWLLRKDVVTSVIVGVRRMDQLEDNLASVDLALTDEEMARLDDGSRLPAGYPHWMTSLGDDRLPGQSRDLEARLKTSAKKPGLIRQTGDGGRGGAIDEGDD